MKKIAKLIDNRGIDREAIRELRSLLNEIDQGDIVGLSFVAIRRDGKL